MADEAGMHPAEQRLSKPDALIDLFLAASGLKWMPRTGWAMRGVPSAESVADHSYGVGIITLILATALRARGAGDTIDVEKAVSIALVHDLAEARLTDLPAVSVRLLGEEAKRRAEEGAMRELLGDVPGSGHLMSLWREFEDGASPEGRLVRDADKLEMMVQCLCYEQAGSQGLEEFWAAMDRHTWHYPQCAHLYRRLRGRRALATPTTDEGKTRGRA